MGCALITYSKSVIHFDMNEVVSITANGNLIYVKLNNNVIHCGHRIIPL